MCLRSIFLSQYVFRRTIALSWIQHDEQTIRVRRRINLQSATEMSQTPSTSSVKRPGFTTATGSGGSAKRRKKTP